MMTRHTSLRLVATVSAAIICGAAATRGLGAKAVGVAGIRSIALEPQPGYGSSAVRMGDDLIVADRLQSTIARFDKAGRRHEVYDKPGVGRGGLAGGAQLAIDGDTLFASTYHGTLLRLNAHALTLMSEEQTLMGMATSRFFHLGMRFFLAGAGMDRQHAGKELFWTEPDPPSPNGERRTVLWTLNDWNERSRSGTTRPLITRASDGGFLVARPDKYEVRKFAADGSLVSVIIPQGTRFRPRPRPAPDINIITERQEYLKWSAEASVVIGPIALGPDRVGIIRLEGRERGEVAPEAKVDVFDYSGHLYVGDVTISTRARQLYPLAGDASGFDFLEVTGDVLQVGSEHYWSRYALPSVR